jgi:hypothetical protein
MRNGDLEKPRRVGDEDRPGQVNMQWSASYIEEAWQGVDGTAEVHMETR